MESFRRYNGFFQINGCPTVGTHHGPRKTGRLERRIALGTHESTFHGCLFLNDIRLPQYFYLTPNYTQCGHKLRFFKGGKAQFVTVGII
jgi:hypothetical protein